MKREKKKKREENKKIKKKRKGKKKQSPTARGQLRFLTGYPSPSLDLPVFCDIDRVLNMKISAHL